MSVPRPSPIILAIACACLAVSVVLLPAWDGLTHLRSEGGIAGLLVGVGLGVASIAVFLRSQLRWRWGAVAGGLAFVVLYASISGSSMILHRSRLVSDLPDCTTGQTSANGMTQEKAEGPHLRSGVPCVQPSEEREAFRQRYPTGEMFDGFRQVIFRYPGDIFRLIMLPMIALFLVATAGILLAKAVGPTVAAQRETTLRLVKPTRDGW